MLHCNMSLVACPTVLAGIGARERSQLPEWERLHPVLHV